MLSPFTQTSVPPALNRYVALATLKRLGPGVRLDLDADTYILRAIDRYIAYRNWMSVVPLVEIFYPDDESALIRWLERFGYSFG